MDLLAAISTTSINRIERKTSSWSLICLCLLGLTGATSNTDAFSASSPPVAKKKKTVPSRKASSSVRFRHGTVNQNRRFLRRAKKLGKKNGFGFILKHSKKCAKKIAWWDHGRRKVTKKCVDRHHFLPTIKSANGGWRTPAPATWNPSAAPSAGMPSRDPSAAPTARPTTSIPASDPTFQPTNHPTAVLADDPTLGPTSGPTSGPTGGPSREISESPTADTVVLTSSLPNHEKGPGEGTATATSSSKFAIGALVGGIAGFAILAAGGWNQRGLSPSASITMEGQEKAYH